VAWLIRSRRVSEQHLAVTFTNKAAAGCAGASRPCSNFGGALWIGIFHGPCTACCAGTRVRPDCRKRLDIGFQDQSRILRKVLKALELDETRWVPREILWFINAQKDEGFRAKHIKDTGDPTRRQLIRIYQAYEEACQRAGVVDFAELLLRAYELWRDNPSLLEHYRTRFRHVLVDEFQDTNAIQYKWLMLLAGPDGLPFAVGDDDQSIYRWRGARVENLNQFRRDYPRATLYKLEQNYRSTGTILKAANALIANNAGRLGKNLWTSGADGDRVKLYAAFNERDEADFVVNRIREWVDRGGARREVAVLYRSNAQSRVFEEAFLNARMPYRVYGGLRFFERAEIKDALAYLRLVASRADDTSFERVVNLPTRGIGAKTLDTLRDMARAGGTSLWHAAVAAVQSGLAQRATQALQSFLQLIEKFGREVAGLELHEQVDHVIQNSGLIEHFKKERGERGEGRVENLLELVSAAKGFSPEGETDMQPLESFLAHAVLESGEGQADPYADCVQMMTLHTAKGLEFPVVFLAGMEDGLFPHQRSIADLASLEEERRLCYVGATRAMRQLYITYAEQRRLMAWTSTASRRDSSPPPFDRGNSADAAAISRPAFAKQPAALEGNMWLGGRVRTFVRDGVCSSSRATARARSGQFQPRKKTAHAVIRQPRGRRVIAVKIIILGADRAPTAAFHLP
jgi:DNA helicase-2/ATP-dependent DNA helicase PcrA